MKQPRTPTNHGVSLKREGSKGPRTPSANRLASQQQQARLERGETAAASAPFSQSTRAWRTGGDRKIMFENRGEQRQRYIGGVVQQQQWLYSSGTGLLLA